MDGGSPFGMNPFGGGMPGIGSDMDIDKMIKEIDAKIAELEKEEEEAEAADDADETADTDETADAEDDLMSWIVKDEAGSSEQPNLVIKGEFKGMGPLAIFTKDAK